MISSSYYNIGSSDWISSSSSSSSSSSGRSVSTGCMK